MSLVKDTADKYSTARRNEQNRFKLVSNCGICVKEKSRFIKNQEERVLLCKLGTRLIPLIGDILFLGTCFVVIVFEMISYKINEIVNKF